MTSQLTPQPDVKQTVLSRIACENICPRARLWYRCREYGVWALWLGTILLSAVAVAVSFFIIAHRQYALFEATHDSFLSFMFEVLPYLWLLVFVIAIGFAYYHFRHTKRGYRYSFFTIAGVTVLASLSGGLFFHYVGMSFVFDDMLGKYMPGMYSSQAVKEKRFWQNSSDGRLLATLQSENASGTAVTVVDSEGNTWEVDITELFPKDVALLRERKEVRILGSVKGSGESTVFHACGVFPWLYSHMMTMAEFKVDRAEAIQRLHDHRNRALAEANLPHTTVVPANTSGDEYPDRRCADIAAVKRLRE